jgi:ketosteroid isomerase-like protein
VSPLEPQIAATIAQEWLHAFNAHRAEQVVEHFAEDVTAQSPVIARLRPASGGILNGKPAVLSFYEDGLRAIRDLHFTLVAVLTGIGQLTILDRNQRDILVAEDADPA